MLETTPLIPDLMPESTMVNRGFQSILDYIDERSSSPYRKGEFFEKVMRQYFLADPIYKDSFSEVYLWNEWAALKGLEGTDTGIDLVAQERTGGYCAIQCKCYGPNTRIQKPHIDSFITASAIEWSTAEGARERFTSRIIVDTGKDWGQNALNTINRVVPRCHVKSFADLASRPIDWPDLALEVPEQLNYRHEPFTLRSHQREALDDVIDGFRGSDRGKMIMACGTGKTFTALKIAEEVGGVGGRVLYLVPSIGLFAQAMREWAEQRDIPHRYIGICSDTHAGKTGEDAAIYELEIPPTTDPVAISEALQKTESDAMTVVFCTYHSLPLVETAQDQGAPEFDLVLCDEAHRTTGVDSPGDKTSPFVLVHNGKRIRSKKRLYMTATPRLYTAGAKAKASHHNLDVFSMDEPAYGDEFHRLPFSIAVERNLLSDYKVAIFTIYEPDADAALQEYVAAGGTEINITDVTKFVGCWRALQNPEGKADGDESIRPLTRAIAFNNTIRNSKRLSEHWNSVIESALQQMPEDQRPVDFRCETAHVDGTHNAFERKNKIDWLKGGTAGECRILSNARCLSEGIDVPALDAVLFMTPRNSHVDIVQAVGRVMRKAPHKTNGYIILPVAIPPGTDPADALDNNERFASVWSVLNALRSHDDRLDAEINKIDLNNAHNSRILIPGAGGNGDNGDEQSLQQLIRFGLVDIPPQDIYAKIVERCGDRRYWESWAKDVAKIFNRVVLRIRGLLDNPDNDTLHEWFESFHDELIKTINASITQGNAVDMMAQHILTRPVFEALFEGYDFAAGNPVSVALDSLWQDFGEFGLEEETRDLKGFYESVQTRAQGIDNSEGRQTVLAELYQKFFKTATKKDADRLGIVYTPVEVVDFILHSAADVLQAEFGRSLSDEGVHIIDPFVGAGTFLARLLQLDLIKDADLERKYSDELHANEIVLLAYYIAAVNIEEVFRGRRGADKGYAPFKGIVLTDTFNLNKKGEEPTLFPKAWLPGNNERAERQQQLPIQVIVGNPPWSAGQKKAEDDNPNVDYPALENRVRETYAARSTTTLKNSLYDTYKMAIRWASDRIGNQGLIAFVTNGSWIDGNTDTGVRACLAEEFSSAYVLNLRGNQRTQGELSKREGGKVFGQGSRAPVAITILVKNPNATHDGCQIHYRDIGDYLSREDKLTKLREVVSISGFTDWQTITPDEHHDWIRQRDPAFAQFYPMGSGDTKAGKSDDAIFGLYSQGLSTGRDPYLYNLSREACIENARRMTEDYLAALEEMVQRQLSVLNGNPDLRKQFDRAVKETIRTKPEQTGEEAIRSQLIVFNRHPDLKEQIDRAVEDAARSHSSSLKWDGDLRDNLRRMKKPQFDENYIRKVVYRPFISTNCYADYTFIQRKCLFSDSLTENRAICVTGKGSTKFFSALITDTIPDRSFHDKSQCFPRYLYPPPPAASNTTDELPGIDQEPDRIDNISDTALDAFRYHYSDSTITKDMIFDYIYGVLHTPSYRERFANDLSKELPHIPFAPDFHTFAEAGEALAALHLGYETCEQYPLSLVFAHNGEPQPHHFRLTEKAMRFANDKTTLIINEHVSLSGIPEEAHRYVVNGRTPLEWFIDRYQIKEDKDSGILNDPNGWFANPRDLVTAIERIVYVSVESTRIIEGLPSQLTDNRENRNVR